MSLRRRLVLRCLPIAAVAAAHPPPCECPHPPPAYAAAGDLAALQRGSPTGGCAIGIPKKAVTPCLTMMPRTLPEAV